MSSRSGRRLPVADFGAATPAACWEMSISRREFEQLLPAAVGNVPVRVVGDVFAAESANPASPGWRIEIEAMPDLRIALLVLPRHRVRIHLPGYDADQAAAFLKRFELYFRRGGG
jgi:phosphatidylserine/phosphatidylglycerophosphate/cardiolipin synthase-like enzyme